MTESASKTGSLDRLVGAPLDDGVVAVAAARVTLGSVSQNSDAGLGRASTKHRSCTSRCPTVASTSSQLIFGASQHTARHLQFTHKIGTKYSIESKIRSIYKILVIVGLYLFFQ